MEHRLNYLPATLISFTTPRHPTEPSTICFVFKDWKTGTACYNILVESFDDRKLTVHFKEIFKHSLELEILEIKTKKWVTGCKTNFKKKEYQHYPLYLPI